MSGGDSRLYASTSRFSRCFLNERTFRFKTLSELQDIEVLFLGIVIGRRGGKNIAARWPETFHEFRKVIIQIFDSVQ